MHFAIIGAGISGLSCADQLVASGHQVTLFDKGRGPGGRMSSRRIETPAGLIRVDHGAQYFTARDLNFIEQVSEWKKQSIVSRWPQIGPDTWVGTPTMSNVVKAMATQHNVLFDHLIKAVSRTQDGWILANEHSAFGPFDAVILAMPAEQTASLLCLIDFEMAQTAMAHRSQPCWAGIYVFDQHIEAVQDVIRHHGFVAWAARNNAKPGRDTPETWVVHATSTWSLAHLESDSGWVNERLLEGLFKAIGASSIKPVASSVQRWRYALSAGSSIGAVWKKESNIGLCGDWLSGPRIECAWLSGRKLGEMIVADLAVKPAMTSA